MDTLIHPPTAVVSDSLVLFFLTHLLTGCCRDGVQLATAIALGGPHCTWVWSIERARTAVATRVMKCVHCNTSWKRRKEIERMGESLGRWRGQEQGSARPMVHRLSPHIAAKLINIRGSGCNILAFRLKQGLQSDPRAIFMTGSNYDVLFFILPP